MRNLGFGDDNGQRAWCLGSYYLTSERRRESSPTTRGPRRSGVGRRLAPPRRGGARRWSWVGLVRRCEVGISAARYQRLDGTATATGPVGTGNGCSMKIRRELSNDGRAAPGAGPRGNALLVGGGRSPGAHRSATPETCADWVPACAGATGYRVILSVTLPFFALILLGYVAARRRWVPTEAVPAFNGFLLYFAVPAMLFRFTSNTPFEPLLGSGLKWIDTVCSAYREPA